MKTITVNVEYVRQSYYLDDSQPVEVFGDDYFEWSDKLGEPTLDNILRYLSDNEWVFTYSEEDCIDFERSDYLDETVLEIRLVRVSDDDLEGVCYKVDEINEAYKRINN